MSGKAKLTPRKLMEMAIDVMRQSVSEPRDDGKASPMVGAVLVKPDGTVDTACRGGFRHGDHDNNPNRLPGESIASSLLRQISRHFGAIQ